MSLSYLDAIQKERYNMTKSAITNEVIEILHEIHEDIISGKKTKAKYLHEAASKEEVSRISLEIRREALELYLLISKSGKYFKEQIK